MSDPAYPSASQANSESIAGVSLALNVGNVPQPPASQRERFAFDELAIALSHFDLGTIHEIREFARGSRKAPKAYLRADAGQFLLKRRARGKDDVGKVAFTHQVQLHLAQHDFPLPHLIGTRKGKHSVLQLTSGVYELFEFIAGQNYPQTLDATFNAGHSLAAYHKLLDGFHSDYKPAAGSFHASPPVEQGLRHIPKMIGTTESATLCAALADAYREAASRVERLGIAAWPSQIVHGDWHPGNLLFDGNRVVAAIDYDSARLLPRVIDAANGALQFSIVGGGEDLARWPAEPDVSRFKRFVKGYDEIVLLSQVEVESVPWLMIEALIAEAVFPIAQTGRFSRFDGLAFLKMVRRKTEWIAAHEPQLVRLLSD